jgi:hypothetical protein
MPDRPYCPAEQRREHHDERTNDRFVTPVDSQVGVGS